MPKIDLLKPKVTFLQKITLIVLGVLLCVFLLEISLSVGGFLVISLQEYRNRIAMKKKGAYRIMCLGESTTAGQYPHFLEEILNKRSAGIKFSVIDKGMSGTNTAVILSQLESNLDEYRPDMVLTMMGINDFGPHLPFETRFNSKITTFFKLFKTYKLIKLVKLHLITKIKGFKFCKPIEVDAGEINVSFGRESIDKAIELNPIDDKAYVALGHFYQGKNNFSKAIKFFNKAIEINPGNDEAYVGAGWCYQSDTQPQIVQAQKSFHKAIDLNPRNDNAYIGLAHSYLIQALFSEAEKYYNKAIKINPKNDMAYAGLGWCYHSRGDFPQALELFEKAVELNAKNHWALIGAGSSCQYQEKYPQAIEYFHKAIDIAPKGIEGYLGLGQCYLKLREYSLAQTILKRAKNVSPSDPRPPGFLATLYMETGQYNPAEEYLEKANTIRLDYYNPLTVDNYIKIKSIFDRRGIKLVCVEYPMRSIESLKKIFKEENGIIFIDNENIFKERVYKDGYDKYFSDRFGGAFGHCRTEGNMLLAGNIANAILKKLFNN